MNTSLNLPQEIRDLERTAPMIPTGIYWKDTQGVYLGCNALTLAMLNLPNQSGLAGNTDFDMPWQEQAEKIQSVDNRVIKTGVSVEFDVCLNSSNGKKLSLRIHQSPLRDGQNRIIGLVGTLADISEQKNLEEKLQTTLHQQEIAQIKIEQRVQSMINTIAGNHWWKDREGHYLGCNVVAANAWGLTSPAEVVGKTDYELPWSVTAHTLIAHDKEVMETGETLTKEEIVQIQNGESLVFMVTKAPLRDYDGQIIGTIGTSIDITEIKRLQQSLLEAKEHAEWLNKLKTQFIMNMEHDIRTPLSGIWGLSEMLKKDETDPERQGCFDDIIACTQEVLDYCLRIVYYSEIEAGSFGVQDKKFALTDLINQVLILEKPAAKHKQLILSMELDEQLPQFLRGDSRRLYQVLVNLTSNAIKFTREGSVKLKVSLLNQPITGKEIVVQFTVEDTGMGIPTDKMDLLYERFNRLTPSNQGIYKGMGLGLRIVKKLVEEMQGEIEVNSQEGQGTQFHCIFPLKIPMSSE